MGLLTDVLLVMLALLLAVAAMALVAGFNRLIATRYLAYRQWERLRAALENRRNLVDSLVGLARHHYQGHWPALAEVKRVQEEARKNRDPRQSAALEAQLDQALHEVLVQAQDNEQLVADSRWLPLQEELGRARGHAQEQCRAYDSRAREYNQQRQLFPGKLWARPFGPLCYCQCRGEPGVIGETCPPLPRAAGNNVANPRQG